MNLSRCISPLLFLSFTVFAQTNSLLAQNDWQNLHGQRVVTSLTARNNSHVTSCTRDNAPAFNCSGVMLRATNHSSSYFAWDPSPASVSSGGVSFSWLRTDSKYNLLAYNYTNGFILYPNQDKPEGKISLDVLCSFPIDASTNDRSDAGCGMYYGQSQSKQCQLQGITDADGWYAHYIQYNHSRTSQCGFGLTEEYADATNAFYQTILSMAKAGSESFNQQNELRIATWQQGIPDKLPLQAFFYINNIGLAAAQADQRDFYNQTSGMFIPVIKLTLPTNPSTDATFTYDPATQVETDSLLVTHMLAIPPTIETAGDKSVAQLTATIRSSNGEAIEGAMVTWITPSASGKLAKNITYTNVAGVATTSFSDTRAENAVVFAYGPDGKSRGIRIIPVNASAAQDLFIDGLNVDRLSISANGQDSATIAALVKSKTGDTVTGSEVHWTATVGSLSSATSVTDDKGAARVILRSTTPGEAVITATLDNGNEQSTWIDIIK